MAKQEGTQGRKTIRVDDLSEGNPPSTRSAVVQQQPGTRGPQRPEDKFAESYARMQEINEQTRQELAAQARSPIISEAPEPAPVVEPPQPTELTQLQSDLSLLATAGCIEEDAIVGGFTFRLRTLSTGDQHDVLVEMQRDAENGIAGIAELRPTVLSRAVVSVNGVPLEQLYEGQDIQLSRVEKKKVILNGLQQVVTAKLFEIYNDMLARSEEAFGLSTEGDETLKN